MVRVGLVPEQALATAQDDRKLHEPVFVDQAQVRELGYEIRAADYEDVAVDLLPEVRDLRADLARQDGRVVPVRARKRSGDDVLGHGVDAPAERVLVGERRPEGSPDFVSGPAKQDAG